MENLNKSNSLLYNLDPENIMSGINNDLDLFNYAYLTKDYRPNIFTSVKKMKENYYEKQSMYIVFPTTEYITKINGSLDGYIRYIYNTLIEISIKKNDKNIFILMEGFNKQEVIDFLNTIIIG